MNRSWWYCRLYGHTNRWWVRPDGKTWCYVCGKVVRD